MLKKALEKLNDRQKEYLETISFIIYDHRCKGNKLNFERSAGKLRGYLEALRQMDIITVSEFKSLYLYYFSKDRF